MIRSFFYSFFVRDICAPLLQTIFVLIPVLLLTEESVQSIDIQLVNQYVAYFQAHPLRVWAVVAFFALCLHIVIPALYKKFEKPKSDTVRMDVLTQAISKMNNVVSYKSERFSSNIAYQQTISNFDDLFKRSADPSAQMYLLGEALFALCELQSPSLELKLRLYEYDGTQLSLFRHWPTDKPTESTDSLLTNPKFTPLYAARQNRSILIPDMKKESRNENSNRFANLSGGKPEGSLYCSPVAGGGSSKSSLVITLWCEKPDYFQGDSFDITKELIQIFANRLRLEHTLKRYIE